MKCSELKQCVNEMEENKMLSIIAPGIRIYLEDENMRETVYSFFISSDAEYTYGRFL